MTSDALRTVPRDGNGECFDDVVLPHLDAAHRLAGWLMRNEHDAEDVVQEASLRAFRYFRTFSGGNQRAWFLCIVRNTCRGWYSHRRDGPADTFDEERHSPAHLAADPERLLLSREMGLAIDHAMTHLPDRLRELLRLRELDGLSYREMADAKGIPIGSVMSGLSRARQALRISLAQGDFTCGESASAMDRPFPHCRTRPVSHDRKDPGCASRFSTTISTP
jgi:RNA polymerase sigma factor (sigma-70 family)